jgi:Virulence factor BrkB
VLTVVVVMLLYRFVPARGLRFRAGLVGAVVTSVLIQLISFASGAIFDQATQLTVVYGSLTAALVVLYSIYLYSSALLLGADVRGGVVAPADRRGAAVPRSAEARRAGSVREAEAIGGLCWPASRPAAPSRFQPKQLANGS